MNTYKIEYELPHARGSHERGAVKVGWKEILMIRNSLADKPIDYVAEEKNHKAWLSIAKRVIGGDYNKADGSTVTSLTIGLRGYPDEICRRALNILNPAE